MTVYPTETQRTTGGALPYTLRKAIGTIKETVPIETAANDLGADLRPSGEDLRGKGICHGGDNETALLVDPARGRWHCFRCSEGGDVVDLVRAALDGELWEALIFLAERFNVELPRRTEAWHGAQDHKTKVRNAATKALAARYQERLTRLYGPLFVLGGETPEEELAALEELARAVWPISLRWASERVNGE